MVNDGTRAYRWDGSNRLLSAGPSTSSGQAVSFSYWPDGTRLVGGDAFPRRRAQAQGRRVDPIRASRPNADRPDRRAGHLVAAPRPSGLRAAADRRRGLGVGHARYMSYGAPAPGLSIATRIWVTGIPFNKDGFAEFFRRGYAHLSQLPPQEAEPRILRERIRQLDSQAPPKATLGTAIRMVRQFSWRLETCMRTLGIRGRCFRSSRELTYAPHHHRT